MEEKCLLQILLIFFSKIVTITCLKAEIYNTQTFETIRSTSYPHFVMFYAPWCGHCKRMQPLWDSYAEENQISGRLKIAKIDCTENTPLCAAENIKAYPTLRLFGNQEKFTYSGSRSIPGFSKFVKESIQNIKYGQVPSDEMKRSFKKSTVHTEDNTDIKALVLTDENFSVVVDENYSFVDFYAPWCPHCVKLEPIWNQLATRYKHDSKVTIAKIDCTAEPSICKNHMVDGYPTLNLYKNGIMINQYNGARSLSNLVNFIESVVERNVKTADQFKVTEYVNKVPETREKLPFISREEFVKGLESHQLLVYFHDPQSPLSNEHLELFEKVAFEIKDWIKEVACVIVDCSVEESFCGSVKVNRFPTIMLYKSVDDKYLYNGPMDMLTIVRFAEEFSRSQPYDKEEL